MVHKYKLPLAPNLVAAATALLCASLSSFAQQVPPATTAGEGDGGAARAEGQGEKRVEALQRVEITAQKRIEPLQEVPASVTAITAKQIQQMGIVSTQDFVSHVPNMTFDSSYTYLNSFVQLRGVAQINNADSPVAVVIDGVPQNNQKQFKMSLVDIQSIEVLKGPQGALYGRNAIGGAVNIVTKPPSDELEGFAGLSHASGNDLTLNAGLSGSLSPGLVRYRVIAQTRKSDGQTENSYLRRKVDGIDHDNLLRGKLSIQPNEHLAIDLQGGYNTFRAGAIMDANFVGGHKVSDPVQPDESMQGKTWGSVGDVSLKIDYELPRGTLTSITAFTDLKENSRGDIDFSNPVRLPGGFFGMGIQAGQGQNLATKMASQELRFVSPDREPVRYIVGTYLLRTRRSLDTRFFGDRNGDINQWEDATPDHPYTGGVPSATNSRLGGASESNRNTAYAVFGQLDADLGKQFVLSTALRYDSDKRTQTDLGGTAGVRSQTFSATQPKVTLTYKPATDNVFYGTYSTGFRSGGWNGPGLPMFKPEKLKNYEAGAKQTLLGGAMTMNLAVFQADSSNYQYFFVDLTRGGAQIISNLDKVRMRGLDFDTRWRIARHFEVDAGIGYTDSRIRKSDYARPADGISTVAGNRTPKNMPLKVTLGGQYEWAVASGQAFARLDIENRSRKYWQIDNLDVQPGFTLLSARLSWSAPRDAWSVSLWGKNLTNEKFYADVNPAAFTGLPYSIGWPAQPRTIGVDAKVRF